MSLGCPLYGKVDKGAPYWDSKLGMRRAYSNYKYGSIPGKWSPSFLLLIGLLFALTHVGFTKNSASEKPASFTTYGELAARMLCGPLDNIQIGLTNFTENTLPHEAKDLRKLLRKYRNRLDLFAFAYPTGPGKDLFLKLRKDIDKGYERMGDFKDLFDAQRLELAEFDSEKQKWSKGVRPEVVTYPDLERVRSRRIKVIKWKNEFLETDRLAAYRAYTCAPDLIVFHNRRAKDLSRFFWGSEKGMMPRRELDGVDNFRWLAAESLNRALSDYPAVQLLRDLEGETAELFHDFRKRVRTVVKIAGDIELLPTSNKRAKKLDELMDDVDDAYGDINDIILDLDLAVESGQIAKVTRLRAEIATEWATLRQWQTKKQVPDAMAEYSKLLRSLITVVK